MFPARYFNHPDCPYPRTSASFLANVISGWSVPATTNDQSNATTFKGLDLQVAKYGTSFNMVHKMGLVKITLGTKSVPTTRNYSASGAQAADATGMKYTDSGTTTVTASNSFDTSCSPYSSLGYWYIVRGSKTGTTYTKTFKSVTTVNTDWEYKDVSVDEGNFQEITVQNNYIKRLCYKFTAVFSCTQTCQEFKLPVKGTMTMQCWGAGARPQYHGKGSGGYVSGSITLSDDSDKWRSLYVHVGQEGSDYGTYVAENYNGGGRAQKNASGNPHGYGGGGGTDIRLASGKWDDADALKSRIIVAGGGAGNPADLNNQILKGSCGGGLNGYDGNRTDQSLNINCGKGGSQTGGGTAPTKYSGATSTGEKGSFGKGGMGGLPDTSSADTGCGGGGGYYGGSGGSGMYSSGKLQGGGGSSFISGFTGCVAVTYGTDKKILRYDGRDYQFSSIVMVDGAGYTWSNGTVTASQTGSPTIDGSTTEIGHIGDGYAKITLTTPTND